MPDAFKALTDDHRGTGGGDTEGRCGSDEVEAVHRVVEDGHATHEATITARPTTRKTTATTSRNGGHTQRSKKRAKASVPPDDITARTAPREARAGSAKATASEQQDQRLDGPGEPEGHQSVLGACPPAHPGARTQGAMRPAPPTAKAVTVRPRRPRHEVMDRRHPGLSVDVHHDRVGRERQQSPHQALRRAAGHPPPPTSVATVRTPPGGPTPGPGARWRHKRRRSAGTAAGRAGPPRPYRSGEGGTARPDAHEPTHDHPDPHGDETGDVVLKVGLADQRNPHPQEHTERH